MLNFCNTKKIINLGILKQSLNLFDNNKNNIMLKIGICSCLISSALFILCFTMFVKNKYIYLNKEVKLNTSDIEKMA